MYFVACILPQFTTWVNVYHEGGRKAQNLAFTKKFYAQEKRKKIRHRPTGVCRRLCKLSQFSLSILIVLRVCIVSKYSKLSMKRDKRFIANKDSNFLKTCQIVGLYSMQKFTQSSTNQCRPTEFSNCEKGKCLEEWRRGPNF